MAESITLTDHDAIRDWAAARGGAPAVVDTSLEAGTPMLRIVFGEQAYQDVDQPLDAGGLQVVEWDEWFRLFDAQKLVMVVEKDQPGRLNGYHQLVKA
ncbi:hypothetical protein [Mesorhizobium sp. SP-1A]|jgi:hypothetical protein|uniref:hypothetical protein n=1 Tax=Mesorhizobium sp. SP-1A TaxID=3077840 RepID=UPI0028F70F2F|nr:hypothetical protein [Mesorhizobium sp. SP-1A]